MVNVPLYAPLYAVFPRQKLRVNLLALPAFLLTVWLEGALPAMLLFLAVLLHEAGHAAALCAFRVPVRRVDIQPMGALIVYDETVCSLRATAWIAFSGAGVNLLLCILSVSVARLLLPAEVGVYLLFFGFVNGGLALLNLWPWEKLDGGKLLFSLLLRRYSPDRCEAICRTVSRVSAILLGLFFFWLAMQNAFPLWSLLLAAVLLAQAFRE